MAGIRYLSLLAWGSENPLNTRNGSRKFIMPGVLPDRAIRSAVRADECRTGQIMQDGKVVGVRALREEAVAPD